MFSRFGYKLDLVIALCFNCVSSYSVGFKELLLGKTSNLSEERLLQVAVGLDPVAVWTSPAILGSHPCYADACWAIFSNKQTKPRNTEFCIFSFH